MAPTEVRRKSAIDREMEVANLLAERDRLWLTPEETAANEEALRSAMLTSLERETAASRARVSAWALVRRM
jgi:phosphoenolpyruvate carboxylase